MIYTYLGFVSFAAVVLYLGNVFYPSPYVAVTYSLLAFLLLFFAIKNMKGINRIVLLLLLAGGSVLLFYYDATLWEVITSFGANLHLISLFLLIPLFGVYMSEAGYLKTLQMTLRKREVEQHKKAHPYRLGYALTASMGSLLNLGSMPLVHKIGVESFTSFKNKKFAMMLVRGFGFCMLWSPYFVNVGLVLMLYDLRWQDIGLYGMILAIAYSFVVAAYYPWLSFSDDKEMNHHGAKVNDTNAQLPPLKGLVCYFIVLLLCSVTMEAMLPFNMLTVVSLLALVYPLCWAVFAGEGKQYIQASFQYMAHSFERLRNEIGIFITAGFFGEALSHSSIGEMLADGVLFISQGYIPLLVLTLCLSTMMLAFVGIHPVIVVTGLGSSLTPEHFGVSPVFMGLLLLISWMLSTQFSPFTGTILMGAQLMNERPITLLKKNAAFVFTLLFTFSVLLSFLEWMNMF
ncbi:hypothetical protein SAMN05192534_101456 [Alteribacillus persepolensis]|uniref:TRAP C4-dicarboxylate transport system permease DctM subunit domain-containing protein n=2 Tax=Alteribacillus persepolensis TaxID=568899 RepID=A0A1G7Z975_9BACI|nr:hypothetical protein SAMN05192534_101456 [Alteribacillus persepolensis]